MLQPEFGDHDTNSDLYLSREEWDAWHEQDRARTQVAFIRLRYAANHAPPVDSGGGAELGADAERAREHDFKLVDQDEDGQVLSDHAIGFVKLCDSALQVSYAEYTDFGGIMSEFNETDLDADGFFSRTVRAPMRTWGARDNNVHPGLIMLMSIMMYVLGWRVVLAITMYTVRLVRGVGYHHSLMQEYNTWWDKYATDHDDEEVPYF